MPEFTSTLTLVNKGAASETARLSFFADIVNPSGKVRSRSP